MKGCSEHAPIKYFSERKSSHVAMKRAGAHKCTPCDNYCSIACTYKAVQNCSALVALLLYSNHVLSGNYCNTFLFVFIRPYLQLVLSCLVSVAASFPHTGLVNQGPQSGPLTPAYGDLVQTPRGLASIALEGFSEDLDQDGYVDPVGQATVPVAVAQPIAPIAHAHAALVHTYAATATIAAPAGAYNFAAPLGAAAPAAIAAAPSVVYNYAAPYAAAAPAVPTIMLPQ